MKFKDIYIGNWKAFASDEVGMGVAILGTIALMFIVLMVADFWSRLPEVFTRLHLS